jgi:choline-glycine betaine transporter
VQTPVGARCPKCAALKKLPVYEISTIFYIRAIAAGLATAAALGAIWQFIPLANLFLLFIALVIGYLIGEAISLAVNRKRGPGLQIVAGISVFVSYAVRSLVEAPEHGFLHTFVDVYGLIALILGIIVAVGLLRRN